MSVTISAKVPKQLKQKAKLYGVRISEVVRKALQQEVNRVEQKSLEEGLDKVSSMLRDTLAREYIAKTIRSSRDER